MAKNKLNESFVSRMMELAGNSEYKSNRLSRLNENFDEQPEQVDNLDVPETNDSEFGTDEPVEDFEQNSMDVNVDELEAMVTNAVHDAFVDTFGGENVEFGGGEEGSFEPEAEEPEFNHASEEPNFESKEYVGKKIAESIFESLKQKGFIKKVKKNK